MHILIIILFVVFAAVQYNDPDAYIWVPAYLIVAAIAFLYYIGKRTPRLILALIIAYGIWMLSYTPDIIHWVQRGLPSITGSMKAESPFIEFVREFFGLFICILALAFYWKQSIKG